MGHTFPHLCIPANFWLDDRQCEFYIVWCWISLYSNNYYSAVFWNVVTFLGNNLILLGLASMVLGVTRAVFIPGLIICHYWGNTLLEITLGAFPIWWVGTDTVLSSVLLVGTVPSNLSWFFPQLHITSLYTCQVAEANPWYIAGVLPVHLSPLCSDLLHSPTLSSDSRQAVCWAPSRILLSTPHPGNTLKAMSSATTGLPLYVSHLSGITVLHCLKFSGLFLTHYSLLFSQAWG